MDCNKDEASRARDIAERKLASQDYHGAQQFAQRAQQLFPSLDNIGQMSAVIDVHIAAQVRINGAEADWYGILQVEPSADDLLIKKQYRRLALLLHPDKNKFAGAEAAFKLIGEASQTLTDRQKRSLYDSKRIPTVKRTQHAKTTQRSQNRHAHKPSEQPYGNRQYSHFSAPYVLPTFWTACPSCRMRFQYLRTYENQNLLCSRCHVPFFASDIYVTGNGANDTCGWPPHYPQQQQGFTYSSSEPFASANNFTGGSKIKTCHTENVARPYVGISTTNIPAYVSANAVNISADSGANSFSKPAYGRANTTSVPTMGPTKSDAEYLHHMCQEEQQVAQGKESCEMPEVVQKNKRKSELEERTEKEQQKKPRATKKRLRKHFSDSSDDDEDSDDSLRDIVSDNQGWDGIGESKTCPRRSSRQRTNVTYKVDESDDEDSHGKQGTGVSNGQSSGAASLKETRTDIKRMEKKTEIGVSSADVKEKEKLADFVKNKIRMNLNLQDQKSTVSMPDLDCQNEKVLGSLNGSIGVPVGVSVESHLDKPGECGTGEATKDGMAADNQEESDDEEDEEYEQFPVPDADFYNFDKDRDAKDVAGGQIWAAYDDKDGMPRYYLRVKEVKSYIPFKVTICWLELQNLSYEQEELKNSGFYFTCGNCFKNADSQVVESVNMFSHIVKWEKGPRGAIKIYPRERDVWGLYRDWEPSLLHMKGDIPLKYEMVEVLTSFSEQVGVKVVLLDKLSGFRTVFKRTEKFVQIPATELFRFSHQVPAHMLEGDEAPDVQKGCWELDPASVPRDLLVSGPNE